MRRTAGLGLRSRGRSVASTTTSCPRAAASSRRSNSGRSAATKRCRSRPSSAFGDRFNTSALAPQTSMTRPNLSVKISRLAGGLLTDGSCPCRRNLSDLSWICLIRAMRSSPFPREVRAGRGWCWGIMGTHDINSFRPVLFTIAHGEVDRSPTQGSGRVEELGRQPQLPVGRFFNPGWGRHFRWEESAQPPAG